MAAGPMRLLCCAFFNFLQFACPHCSREGQYVADVLHACQIHDAALEAETEARVARGAVFPEIEIEIILAEIHAELFHSCLQLLIVIFSLAAAHDLADGGNEAVHGGDGFAVVVLLHIEGLAVLRIVDDEDGLLEDLLREISLVLCLELFAPFRLVFKLYAGFLQDVDGFGIGDASEVGFRDVAQTLDQSLVDEGIEEVQFFRRVLKNIVDDVFEHALREIHVVFDIREGDFRLDHPEFRGVSRGVGVFGAEGRAEGVNVAEGLCVGFSVQLPGNREVGRLAEEILRVIHGAVLSAGRIADVQSRHLEHFAGALCVRARDDRGVDVDKTALLEELMDRVGDQRADAERRLECIRARAQMRNRAQELHAVALFLHREVRCRGTFDRDGICLDLEGLLRVRRGHQSARDDNGGAHVQVRDFTVVFHGVVDDDLQCVEAGAVMEHHEAEGL